MNLQRKETAPHGVTLRPVEKSDCRLIVDWLAEKGNSRWLDFGPVEAPSALSIFAMAQREFHCMRLFAPEPSDAPAGVVALSDIHPRFHSARLWYVLGDKRQEGRGLTTRAVARMLTVGFRELRLRSINAWVVAENAASIAILRKNGFREIGRLRDCHGIDNQVHDRLLFDLLASEHSG